MTGRRRDPPERSKENGQRGQSVKATHGRLEPMASDALSEAAETAARMLAAVEAGELEAEGRAGQRLLAYLRGASAAWSAAAKR